MRTSSRIFHLSVSLQAIQVRRACIAVASSHLWSAKPRSFVENSFFVGVSSLGFQSLITSRRLRRVILEGEKSRPQIRWVPVIGVVVLWLLLPAAGLVLLDIRSNRTLAICMEEDLPRIRNSTMIKPAILSGATALLALNGLVTLVVAKRICSHLLATLALKQVHADLETKAKIRRTATVASLVQKLTLSFLPMVILHSLASLAFMAELRSEIASDTRQPLPSSDPRRLWLTEFLHIPLEVLPSLLFPALSYRTMVRYSRAKGGNGAPTGRLMVAPASQPWAYLWLQSVRPGKATVATIGPGATTQTAPVSSSQPHRSVSPIELEVKDM